MARPLVPTPASEAAEVLRAQGCVRIDNVLSAEASAALKVHILGTLIAPKAGGESGSTTVDWASGERSRDLRYVVGTRLRFSEAIDVGFAGFRHDVLLPLEDPLVADALATAAHALGPVLEAAIRDRGLPALYGLKEEGDGVEGGGGDDDDDVYLELVEVASLIARCGSKHQQLHADYRRFSEGDDEAEDLARRAGKLPPRYVAFVYLQDVPTPGHGPTVFLPRTHTYAAHAAVYGDAAQNGRGAGPGQVGIARALEVASAAAAASAAARLATSEEGTSSGAEATENTAAAVLSACGVRAGDCVVYDASVLHLGSGNDVPGNDRALFYFGVAPQGGAALLAGDDGTIPGHVEEPPVLLSSRI